MSFQSRGLVVHHIQDQILIAADIAQLQKSVSVAQACHMQVVRRRGDLLPDRRPVDGLQAVTDCRVREAVGREVVPVGQWMADHGAGDAVGGCLPTAAKAVGVGMVLPGHPGHPGKLGCERKVRRHIPGEQQRMGQLHFHQKFLGVGLPASVIDAKDDGDIIGALKSHSVKIIFFSFHRKPFPAI